MDRRNATIAVKTQRESILLQTLRAMRCPPIDIMNTPINLSVITLLLAASSLSAATHYVSLGSTNPTPPYATWARAATNIQDAVDAATFGDTVVVTNGLYPGGVWVTKPLTLLSVNGPQFTVIQGGAPCVSLTNGGSLTGFTLTNGSVAGDGGGVDCYAGDGGGLDGRVSDQLCDNRELDSIFGWRCLWGHALQLHADRELLRRRRRGGRLDALQLHADRELLDRRGRRSGRLPALQLHADGELLHPRRRGVSLHPLQLHAGRELRHVWRGAARERRRSGWMHALQLYAGGELLHRKRQPIVRLVLERLRRRGVSLHPLQLHADGELLHRLRRRGGLVLAL